MIKFCAILCALTLTAASQEPTIKPERFFNRTNLTLFSADALARTLDAQSTRRFLDAPCKCYQEAVIPFATGSSVGTYVYSYGVVAGLIGTSYLFHHLGHHRLEHLPQMIDIVVETPAIVSNYQLRIH